MFTLSNQLLRFSHFSEELWSGGETVYQIRLGATFARICHPVANCTVFQQTLHFLEKQAQHNTWCGKNRSSALWTVTCKWPVGQASRLQSPAEAAEDLAHLCPCLAAGGPHLPPENSSQCPPWLTSLQMCLPSTRNTTACGLF